MDQEFVRSFQLLFDAHRETIAVANVIAAEGLAMDGFPAKR